MIPRYDHDFSHDLLRSECRLGMDFVMMRFVAMIS
jgi:hypothetical protein